MTRILIIATSADKMNPSDEPTGVWLEELTTPYYAFKDSGAEVTLASIEGGAIPVDQRSLDGDADKHPSVQRYFKDEAFKSEVAHTPAFSVIDASGYDALFLPGGHGTMFDYPDNKELATLVEEFDRDGKVVAAVCHGPAGLVSAKNLDGTSLVSGRRIAAFTDSEERAVGLDKAVPFLLESRMKELGAKHEAGPDFEPFAVVDRNLVTGQNPQSAARTAELVMQTLAARGEVLETDCVAKEPAETITLSSERRS